MERNERDDAAGLSALLEPLSAQIRDVFLSARRLVREVLSDTVEQVDLPDRLLAYGYGEPGRVRMAGFAVALIPHTRHVNVQLADGATLDDPAGIIEGTGKRIRHVKCRTVDDVARPALRALLQAQGQARRPPGEGTSHTQD